MNIPPILERLLLSNEAVFKNATLGLSGQNMVFVPPGKTAVLLEFSIEPFINTAGVAIRDLYENGSQAIFNDVWQILKQRLCYQLQIINDNYATYFSFHDCFSIVNTITGPTDNQADLNLSFSGKREELFIYTDRSIYFNFIYPFVTPEIGADNPGLSVNYGTPDVDFLAKIQDLPETPTAFKNNAFQKFVTRIILLSTGLDSYLPVNNQTNGATYDQQEYLRFFCTSAPTSIEQPRPTSDDLTFGDLFKLPLLNVKYALINKKASDYGITPGKL